MNSYVTKHLCPINHSKEIRTFQLMNNRSEKESVLNFIYLKKQKQNNPKNTISDYKVK